MYTTPQRSSLTDINSLPFFASSPFPIPQASKYPEQFELHYSVSEGGLTAFPDDGDKLTNVKGHQARLSKELLTAVIPAPSSTHAALYCGPPDFDEVCRLSFLRMGFRSQQTHAF